MTEKPEQKKTWRDRQSDVLRENLKKRKMMQKGQKQAQQKLQEDNKT